VSKNTRQGEPHRAFSGGRGGHEPEIVTYRTPVRSAAPQAIGLARVLGWLYGKAIKGHNGSIRYGWPGLDSQRTKYAGYVYPPQLFVGYNPAKVAGGLIRADPASLPGDSLVATEAPLMRAMAAMSATEMGAPT